MYLRHAPGLTGAGAGGGTGGGCGWGRRGGNSLKTPYVELGRGGVREGEGQQQQQR